MKTLSISRYAVPAALVVAALALTGCSSGDAKKSKDEAGPLQKYMSAMWGDEEFTQEKFDKQQEKTEELVAECMAKEGFDYKPNTENGGMVYMSGDDGDDGPEWGSVKFAETYGYGFINSPGMDSSNDSGDDGKEPVDPNQKYIDSLSESEQQAYNVTLWGPPMSEDQVNPDDEDAAVEYDWKQGGCYGAAQHKAQGSAAEATDDPEFKDLFEQINNMYSEVYGNGSSGSTNEDMVKLDRKWAECMTEAGYDFPTPMQAQNSLQDEWMKVQDAGASDSGEYKEPSKEEKKKFQDKEIKTAVADAKCQDKLKYTDEQTKITNKIEQKFVDEHKAELDAMIAKYGSKKKEK
ncbi:hypothetical protein G7068_03965 [Leucobacter viscericola]|uniref:Uncharacterized protein n=1 Tax=Leucobacter viscericola TaxID=2714935 RepID=A0A6G7XDL8_9MICO|nr:hypothetical protein [Leucobacter viscericola]QIK62461.1 hypothetical protein G7068_03965 [Leucobacter viscericola]